MLRNHWTLLIGIGALSGALWAADLPDFKAGLWNVTTTLGASARPRSGQMCMSPAVIEQLVSEGASRPDRICKRVSSTHSGSSWTEQTDCTINGQTLNSSSVTTFEGDSAFHTESHRSNGSSSMTDGKYVSACPADMEPGDFVTAKGFKINILHPQNFKLPPTGSSGTQP